MIVFVIGIVVWLSLSSSLRVWLFCTPSCHPRFSLAFPFCNSVLPLLNAFVCALNNLFSCSFEYNCFQLVLWLRLSLQSIVNLVPWCNKVYKPHRLTLWTNTLTTRVACPATNLPAKAWSSIKHCELPTCLSHNGNYCKTQPSRWSVIELDCAAEQGLLYTAWICF